MKLRLGTRASRLARWQADWIAARLKELDCQVEMVPLRTEGDRRTEGPIGAIGTQGVFTKELQRALLERRIDLAVHSLKDLSTEPVAGLVLAATPRRGPTADCLVAQKADSFDGLPHGAIVGTGSLRRKTQLLYRRPDLDVRDIRGNVETRLEKCRRGEYDAIVLAEAGLVRLELAEAITDRFAPETLLSAVGQGALGVEARADDTDCLAILAKLDDPHTRASVVAERTMMARLEGGCLAPIGAWGRVDENGRLLLTGRVMSLDGRTKLDVTEIGTP